MDKELIELRGDAVLVDTRVWIKVGIYAVVVPVGGPNYFGEAHFMNSGIKCADGTPIWTQQENPWKQH